MSRRITRSGTTATLGTQKSAEVIDDLGDISIVDRDLTAPPSSPTQGDRYIPAATATGDWVGQEGNVAIWVGAWIFLSPIDNMRAWLEDEKVWIEYDGDAWVHQQPSLLNIESKGAAYTIVTPDDNGKLFINSAAITITLPAATVGQHYFFSVGSANDLTIATTGTNTVSLPATGIPGSASKGIVAGAIGESIHLACAIAANWVVIGGQGVAGIWVAEA